MVDERRFDKCKKWYADFSQKDFWFSLKKDKFLHNIDTFYYSIKCKNDFLRDTADIGVLAYRAFIDKLRDQVTYDGILCEFGEKNLLYRRCTFAGMYDACWSVPDYYDIFVMSVAPPCNATGDLSQTTEIVVQIRSHALWLMGISAAYQDSLCYVLAFMQRYRFEVDFVQENRLDYCWHTNYLQDPESYLNPERFSKMYVSRLDPNFQQVGSFSPVYRDGYQYSFMSMGKRSQSVYFRMYDKVREVLEMHYKPWFFQLWLFHGLISRYDLYCYEYCYKIEKKAARYNAMAKARLSWAYEYLFPYDGSREYELLSQDAIELKLKIYRILKENYLSDNPEAIASIADQLTPLVTRIFNIEYQTNRRFSKTFVLPDLQPYYVSPNGINDKRINDILLCRPLVADYLTYYTLRLTDPAAGCRKKDAPLCAFWVRLRQTKMVDAKLHSKDLKLVREYVRNLDKETVKRRLLSSAITYGFYNQGDNSNTPEDDVVSCLCRLNDNDLETYWRKKNHRRSTLRKDVLDPHEPDPTTRDLYLIDADGMFF